MAPKLSLRTPDADDEKVAEFFKAQYEKLRTASKDAGLSPDDYGTVIVNFFAEHIAQHFKGDIEDLLAKTYASIMIRRIHNGLMTIDQIDPEMRKVVEQEAHDHVIPPSTKH